MNKLEGHEFIKTDDGSFTAYSKRYNEACHSTSGAISETKLHYIEGCKLLERSKKLEGPFSILEVGFGVGIGFLETAKAMKGSYFKFLSLEIDESLVSYICKKNEILNSYQRIEKDGLCFYEIKNEDFDLKILIGDARLTLPLFAKKEELSFHAVYQDAFSPKRNPDLWTVEWFELLKTLSNKSVLLSTYSSSSSIRKSMIKAGWKLSHGEKFGPKRSSTRASLIGLTEPSILEHLSRSHAITLDDSNKHSYQIQEPHENK